VTGTIIVGNTDTATPTFSPTVTSTIDVASTDTVTPTVTATVPSCAGVYSTAYTFDTDTECWKTLNELGSTTVSWADAPPTGSTPGALQANITFDATDQSGETIYIDIPETDLTGKRLTLKVYVDATCKGASWGGAVSPFVVDSSTGWHDTWINISSYGSWQTYTLDVNSTAVTQMGLKVYTGGAAGAAAIGNVYLDSFTITDAPPTSTPTEVPSGCVTTLLHDCEALDSNGTWNGTSGTLAIETGVPDAITEGSAVVGLTLAANGWDQTSLAWTAASPGAWGSYSQLLLDIYIPTTSYGTWCQFQMVGNCSDTSTFWVDIDSLADPVALHSGMNHVAIPFNWSNGSIAGTDAISQINFILNSDQVVGQPIYIDNVRLEACP